MSEHLATTHVALLAHLGAPQYVLKTNWAPVFHQSLSVIEFKGALWHRPFSLAKRGYIELVLVEGLLSVEWLEHGLRLLVFGIKFARKDGVSPRHLIVSIWLYHYHTSSIIDTVKLFIQLFTVEVFSDRCHVTSLHENCGSTADAHSTEFDLFVGVEDAHLNKLIISRAKFLFSLLL